MDETWYRAICMTVTSLFANSCTRLGECAGVRDVHDFFNQVCQLSSKPLSILKGKASLQDAQSALEAAGWTSQRHHCITHILYFNQSRWWSLHVHYRYEIFSTDNRNAQLSLSACFNQDAGKWLLAAVSGTTHTMPPALTHAKIHHIYHAITTIKPHDNHLWNAQTSHFTHTADFPRKCGSKGVHRLVAPRAPRVSGADTCVPNQHGPACSGDVDCISHANCLRSVVCGVSPVTHLSCGVRCTLLAPNADVRTHNIWQFSPGVRIRASAPPPRCLGSWLSKVAACAGRD